MRIERGIEAQHNSGHLGPAMHATTRQRQQQRNFIIKDKAANEIGEEGACAISEALKVNTTLQTLDLGSRATTKKSCARHGTTTVNNKADNKIGEYGARALSAGLKINTTLTTLDLWCEQQ